MFVIKNLNLKGLLVGDPCDTDAECRESLGDSYCTANICGCTTGMAVPSADLTQCLPVVDTIGGSCSESLQCTDTRLGEYSGCLPSEEFPYDKVCQCLSGAITEGNGCYPKRNLVGDECFIQEQCTANIGNLSECASRLCKCVAGSVANMEGLPGTRCLPGGVLLGSPCMDSAQCVGNPLISSICSSSVICTCREEYVPASNFKNCLIIRHNIGDACLEDAQCTHGSLGTSSGCFESKCNCTSDSVPGGNGTKCLPKAELGMPCQEDVQCQQGEASDLTMCYEGICSCGPDATNEPGKNICRPKALFIGDPCERNAQCKANLGNLSECLAAEVCICTPYYGVPNILGNKCLPVINFIGGECEERQQCTTGTPGEYSDCVNSPFIPDQKVCNCTEGSEHLPGRHECQKAVVFIGQPCKNDDQCAGEPAVSSLCSTMTGLCSCRGGYIPSKNNDDCLPIWNNIGDSCVEALQCQLGIPGPLSDCFQDMLTCNCTKHSANEPGQHLCHRLATLVGDSCQVDVQCFANLGEYSLCLGGNCECVGESIPSSDKSECIIE